MSFIKADEESLTAEEVLFRKDFEQFCMAFEEDSLDE